MHSILISLHSKYEHCCLCEAGTKLENMITYNSCKVINFNSLFPNKKKWIYKSRSQQMLADKSWVCPFFSTGLMVAQNS